MSGDIFLYQLMSQNNICRKYIRCISFPCVPSNNLELLETNYLSFCDNYKEEECMHYAGVLSREVLLSLKILFYHFLVTDKREDREWN